MPWYAIAATVIAADALLLLLLFCFAVKPNRRRDCSRFTGKLFAHRGLHDGTPAAPENSGEAFARAARSGYGVELDVQFTKDKQLVVFHDETLKRMCGADIKVRELTFEQLQEYPLAGGSERVMRFNEVLEILGATPIVCEIKYYGSLHNDELCAATVKEIDGYAGDVCVESFSPYIIQWFKKHRPDIVRGQLSAEMKGEKVLRAPLRFMLSNLVVNLFSRPDFIAYDFHGATFGMRLCRAMFRPLMVAWTVRSREELEFSKKKYSSFIFERFLPIED